jgi:3-deoxy-D-manno-octulosonate 8-phosphate phosphatase (KDO 8-P phosphatase)
MTAAVVERASRIRLLLMDVDGVLTDGTYFHVPGPQGEWVETKAFNTQDGIALKWLHEAGIAAGLISGRKSRAVELRAEQGKFKYVYQGNTEKIPMLEEILADAGLRRDEVGYIGDDFTDVVIMHRVGFAVAVGNARPEVKREAHFVTSAAGGDGAVREAIEVILKAQGLWDGVLKHYEIGNGDAAETVRSSSDQTLW